jgi:hypothetical protein
MLSTRRIAWWLSATIAWMGVAAWWSGGTPQLPGEPVRADEPRPRVQPVRTDEQSRVQPASAIAADVTLTLPTKAAPAAADQDDFPVRKDFVGPYSLINQTAEQAHAKSWGCLTCHVGIEDFHASPNVHLGCCDCHGGNPCATTIQEAHEHPWYPERWPTSGTPKKTFALINTENPRWVRFINPGDFRHSAKSCGTAGCHTRECATTSKTIMAHSAMVPGSALYNNGAVPNKIYRFGEVYGEDGTALRAFSNPRATIGDVRNKGVVPWIDPVPNWRITQPDFAFRILEINNNATSVRGPGTNARIDAVFLNVVKTKLNDPTMAHLGMCNNPGDYRSSGCTSCHVLYANDRDPEHSAHIAQYGNRGYSFSADRCIPRNDPGHPIKHQLTRAIPSSQCVTCHFHQGSGALGNYYGYVWWDYETDAEKIYSRYGAPRPGGLVGPDFSDERHDLAPTVNPELRGNKFADFHNNTWMYQAVYKRDRKGNLIDKDGKQIDENDPNWHKMAVHLADIHLKKGMHCVDCHFDQDVHGTGQIYGAMIDPVEINCKDCHGTIFAKANLITSNASGGNNLRNGATPFGQRRFYEREGKIFQRSAVTPDVEWELVQVADVISPDHPRYNEKARYAKTIRRDGTTWGSVPTTKDDCARLAHAEDNMTCYVCHTTWNTSCGGCHLSAFTNRLTNNLHYEGEAAKFLAEYNPQGLRSDAFFLGRSGTVQGNRITTVRSASGVIVSAQDGNRATVVHQQPTVSAEGFSGHAFSPNPPHTVGGKGETKQCSDCHISEKNDNNAVVGQLLGLGVKAYDFMGRYAWVATGEEGVEAVQVASTADYPTPIIGSNMHRISEPDAYREHFANGGELDFALRYRTADARNVVRIGEWCLVADGPRGLRVLDQANLHNKDQAQRILESTLAPGIGQNQNVDTKCAMWVSLAVALPIDPTRPQRPENEEQKVNPIFRYAFVADYVEGLVVIDYLLLLDGNPSNNNLQRVATFNPKALLTSAVKVKIWGEHAYVLTKDYGMFVINVSDPTCPRLVSMVPLNCATSLDFQFRYAFVTDAEGLKTIDITHPEQPVVKTVVPISDARDVWVTKTYAYVAAGRNGIAILEVDNPEHPSSLRWFNADGCINDATGIVTAMEGNAFFAFVADGCNGLKVIQLISPADGQRVKGFSPEPNPQLIATYPTRGRALSISEGLPRDRYVDIDGNQIGVLGRRGSRPFTREEQYHVYRRNGEVYSVTDTPPNPPSGPAPKSRTTPQTIKRGLVKRPTVPERASR